MPEDTKITIEMVNRIFHPDNGGAFSYPIKVDMDANLPVFGTSTEVKGDSVFEHIRDCRYRLYGGGVVLLAGVVKMAKDVDIEINDFGHREVEIKLESNKKEWEKLFEDVSLHDIDISRYKIQIGYCLPEYLEFDGEYSKAVYGKKGSLTSHEYIPYTRSIPLPHLMVPHYYDSKHGGKYSGDFVNVQNAYNPNDFLAYPYCNVRVCYKKYEKKGNEWQEKRGYNIGEPDRVNSAPCIYVGFVQDVLFRQMGLVVEKNSLNNIVDFRRLAFYHCDAEYDAEPIEGAEWSNEEKKNKFTIKVGYRSGRQYVGYRTAKSEDDYGHTYKTRREIIPKYQLCKAYLNSENLPDEDAKTFIDALQNAFGARYIYDSEKNTLSILLVRDLLAQSTYQEMPGYAIGEPWKTESDKRGVIISYSSSSSNKKQVNGLDEEKVEDMVQGSDDTTYNYNDYRHPYIFGQEPTDGRTKIDDYGQLIGNIADDDLRVYLDPKTGNAYRIKVDGNAETEGDWNPSLFEVGGYRDVKIGDCSDDEYVEKITIGFKPALPNDVNFIKQYEDISKGGGLSLKVGIDNDDVQESIDLPFDEETKTELVNPLYAMFVDGEIHQYKDQNIIQHRYVFNNIVLAKVYDYKKQQWKVSCHVDVNLDLHGVEDFVESGGADSHRHTRHSRINDGPYYSSEPEFVLGVMRGSGSGAGVAFYDSNCDGFGTEKYTETAGSDAEFTSDTMNTYGSMYDYNGGGRMLVTPAMAVSYMNSYFSLSNYNLVSKARNVAIVVKCAEKLYALCCIVNTSQQQEIRAYCERVYASSQSNGNSFMEEDAKQNRYAVATYEAEDSANEMAAFLSALLNIHRLNKEAEVDFPDNGLGYTPDDLISLKLKAEKPVDGKEKNGEYYPVTNELAKKRGIVDKFYGTYINWLLNMKILHIPMMMTVDELVSIDLLKRYKCGEVYGFIDKLTYTISDEGVNSVNVEFVYI